MVQPTIYKPSVYNGNGIYKNGAGGGGVAEWFGKYKWNGNNAFSYNGNGECFEQNLYDNGQGFGAFRIFNRINLSQKKYIELGLNLYLQQRTNISSVTATIFNTQTISGIANNKIRLVRLMFAGGTGDTNRIIINVPKVNNGWTTDLDIPITLPGDFKIKLFFDYNANKLNYKINDIEGEINLTITPPPTDFTPCYFMGEQAFANNSYSNTYLWFYEKMYLKGTYLKADGEILYGVE